LPLISDISKFRYKQRLKAIPANNKIKTALHFIIERWDDTSAFAADSFLKTEFNNNVKIFFYCHKEDNGNVLNILKALNKENVSFEIIFKAENYPLFEQALRNSISLTTYNIHGFCHAGAIFNTQWLENSIALGIKLSQENTSRKIGAFSSYNPNDYRLFDTLFQNEDYTVKSGFSFLTVFFYKAFLQKVATQIFNDSSSKRLMEIFKNYDFFAAFTNKSFIEGINNKSEITAENFYDKPNNLSFAQNPVASNWQATTEKINSLTYLKLHTLIIQINFGGLGDHLFYSHLPRIAKETGRYDKVYISNQSGFRQEAFKKLIWMSNPYVDGFTDLPGYIMTSLKYNPEINIMDQVMLLSNLDDGKRFHEPELYFKPIIKPELQGKIIFDPNYISNAGDKISKQNIENYFQKNNINIDYQMQLRDMSVSISNFTNWLHSDSLEDFMSIIVSCKEIYCFVTGTATLACALGKKAHVFYDKEFSRQFLHSKINTYVEL